MTGAGEARRRAPRIIRGLMICTLVLTGLWGVGVMAAKRGESASAERQLVVEVPLANAEGGIAAELPSDYHAVAVATRGPNGELSVGCADPETAASMVAEVAP
jgi:hypothetical protein